jgi:hypothetical protein
MKQEFFMECAPLCSEKVKDALNCMGTTDSICYRNHTNIACISGSAGLWTYIDWDFFGQLSKHSTPLKTVTLHNAFHIYIMSV